MQLLKQQMDELYLTVKFNVRPISGVEILIAELSYLGFEMFEENQFGLIAVSYTHLTLPTKRIV